MITLAPPTGISPADPSYPRPQPMPLPQPVPPRPPRPRPQVAAFWPLLPTTTTPDVCGCGRTVGRWEVLCERTWRDANAAPNAEKYRQHRCGLTAGHTGEHHCRYLHGHRGDQYARQVVTR